MVWMRLLGRHSVFTCVRPLAADELMQQDAKRVDVAGLADMPIHEDFRGHVGGRLHTKQRRRASVTDKVAPGNNATGLRVLMLCQYKGLHVKAHDGYACALQVNKIRNTASMTLLQS